MTQYSDNLIYVTSLMGLILIEWPASVQGKSSDGTKAVGSWAAPAMPLSGLVCSPTAARQQEREREREREIDR